MSVEVGGILVLGEVKGVVDVVVVTGTVRCEVAGLVVGVETIDVCR